MIVETYQDGIHQAVVNNCTRAVSGKQEKYVQTPFPFCYGISYCEEYMYREGIPFGRLPAIPGRQPVYR